MPVGLRLPYGIKMKLHQFLKNITIAIICMTTTYLTADQSTGTSSSIKSLESQVLSADALFWESYNQCNTENMGTFLTEGLEFYHDKDGLTSGSKKVIASIKNNLCSRNWKLKRQAIDNSVEVFPLNNYGAILTGEHAFYIVETDQSERLDTTAKFTHIWQLINNRWKMSRIISYDHTSAQQPVNNKQAISISEKLLKYVGQYQAPETGIINITKEENGLKVIAGEMRLIIHAESDTVFFHNESPLTFEFLTHSNNNAHKMIIRENGHIVEEATRTN